MCSQTLLAMVMQVVVGRLKHVSFTSGVVDARNRGKKYRWHGKVGRRSTYISAELAREA